MAEKYTEEERQGAEGGAQVYQDPSKKGLPWWLWPLLALLLLGLLFALFHNRKEVSEPAAPAETTRATPAGATTNGQPVPPGPPAGGTDGQDIKVHSGTDITTAQPAQVSVPGVPLSDVVAFAAATDPLTFVGRKAKLTNVQVRKVVTDRAFFVGPSDTQQMLVLLDKGMDAGASGAAKVTVATGKPVSLIGVVEKLPTQEAVSQTYGVSGADYTALQSQKAYLHATVVQEK